MCFDVDSLPLLLLPLPLPEEPPQEELLLAELLLLLLLLLA